MEIIKTAREYFAKKFKGTIFDNITKEMNDNEIVKLYEKSIYTTNELQEIKENGTTLYFVTFLESQKADIEKYMVEKKCTLMTIFAKKLTLKTLDLTYMQLNMYRKSSLRN